MADHDDLSILSRRDLMAGASMLALLGIEAAQAGGKVLMARVWLVVGGLALFGAGLVVGLFVRG